MAVSRLPSLNALKAFESVARLGALNRAAEELNVTESAVSRQIRALEDDLRVELFRRVHRGVRLSPEGEQLALSLGTAFEAMRRGVEQIVEDADAPALLGDVEAAVMRETGLRRRRQAGAVFHFSQSNEPQGPLRVGHLP